MNKNTDITKVFADAPAGEPERQLYFIEQAKIALEDIEGAGVRADPGILFRKTASCGRV